jgi:hypothetical protein
VPLGLLVTGEVFPRLPLWAELLVRSVPPPPDETELPRSLVARLGGADHRADDAGAVLVNALALLITAASTPRFQEIPHNYNSF